MISMAINYLGHQELSRGLDGQPNHDEKPEVAERPLVALLRAPGLHEQEGGTAVGEGGGGR